MNANSTTVDYEFENVEYAQEFATLNADGITR